MAQTTDAINFGDLQGFYDQHMQDVVQPNANKGIPSEAICSTAGGTAAKVTNTTPSSFSLVAGAKIVVKFTYAITVANATLQVGESTAKPIYYKGAALGANLVQAGSSILLHYDGNSFNIVGDLNTDTTYSVMGASGTSHSGGLVPDTPSTAGTSKFLREDGTWTEPAGSNYTAGSGIDISNDEISVDNTVALKTDLANERQGNGIGTCSTSSGTALTVSLTGYELVANGFVAVTFENDVPAGATLNVNGKGAKAIIYKGAAIDGDTIKADDTALFSYDGTNYVLISSGEGGGSVKIVEFLTVKLTSNQTNPNSDLIGATVVITDTESSETLFSTTWQGTDLEFEIPTGTVYQVTVGAVSGYVTPAAVTHTAGLNKSRTETFTYNTEVVTVTCTTEDNQAVTGHKVTINNVEYTLDSTGIVVAKVPYGTSYSVSAEGWSGYVTPAAQSFTALQSTRSVSVVWGEIQLGAYIEATDGSLYTSDRWPSSKTANSIVLKTANISRRISLTRIFNSVDSICPSPNPDTGSSPDYSAYVTNIPDSSNALNDFNGYENTNKMVSYFSNTAYVAGACKNFTFPNGQKGYLPACGEMHEIGLNSSVIDACLAACGGESFQTNDDYWTSTFGNDNKNKVYCINYATGDISHYGGGNYVNWQFYCRPISAY